MFNFACLHPSFNIRAAFKSKLWLALMLLVSTSFAYAGPAEQAKRIHERLTGVAPDSLVLDDMTDSISDTGNGIEAAQIAMEDDNFYRVTIRNWAAPWTNRNQDVFVDLNDYTATIMGYALDGLDFRGILYEDRIYTFEGLASYSPANNNHYIDAQNTDPNSYRFIDGLQSQAQSSLNPNLPSDATAGVMTTRAAAEAFFVDGTNRAMFRFTLLNHMCMDLEQLQDASLPPDRVRQDVSRSPGGDSRVFSSNCVTCHAGMDPMAQAFAYYDFENDITNEAGNEISGSQQLIYNRPGAEEIYEKSADGEILLIVDPVTGDEVTTRTQGKYHINSTTFKPGFVTTDDRWDNYWRGTRNDYLGWNWDGSLDGSGSGNGAKTMGMELAHSKQFASCQVEKVFKAVCLRDPINTDDRTAVNTMITNFTRNEYKIKPVFAEAANYCTTGL